jgi:hypothetical protein
MDYRGKLDDVRTGGSKAFFFEKKKQKTFTYFGFGLSGWLSHDVNRLFDF